MQRSTNFPQKFLQCLSWGIRNMSSFGSNLSATSTNGGENLLVVVFSIFGLGLFMYLLGHMQAARIPEKVKLGRQVKPWCPPSAGWLKANIDGAFHMTTWSGGLGVVIRDSVGTVVAGACGTCTDVASPVVVKALACRLACKVVVDNDLGPVMFEADCLQVVQAICAEGEDTSDFGRIIDDISSLLSSLAGSFFSHVYRESNKLAHKVAKYALLSGAQVSWSGHVPPGLDGLFSTLCTR
ncbi:uncharacterized protein LOC133723945 isoform X2 [Rosa rugosa]|uniref:uncharacterized protein LOC133723945 isoform X2 n=1 Tax=Rosa rugosa TaxID=74645 RepID=UPI002B41655A|nr:uncharacterized protein LOC133723945 isoform X2 [Rosa rugosa]